MSSSETICARAFRSPLRTFFLHRDRVWHSNHFVLCVSISSSSSSFFRFFFNGIFLLLVVVVVCLGISFSQLLLYKCALRACLSTLFQHSFSFNTLLLLRRVVAITQQQQQKKKIKWKLKKKRCNFVTASEISLRKIAARRGRSMPAAVQ